MNISQIIDFKDNLGMFAVPWHYSDPGCPVILEYLPRMVFDHLFEKFATDYLVRPNFNHNKLIVGLSWHNFQWNSIKGLVIQNEINGGRP